MRVELCTSQLNPPDEINILNSIKRMLRNSGWDMLTFSSPTLALEEIRARDSINIIVSDYRMPEMDGIFLLNQAKILQPHALRILLSGQTDMVALLQAVNEAEIYRFITKPWSDDELRMTLKNALQHQALQEENIFLSNTVRQQTQRIHRQQKTLEYLERESPGITQLLLDEDGSIDLSKDFKEDE